jgi:hypothetical protein
LFSRSIVDRKLGKKDEKMRAILVRRMVERCEGMFLWMEMPEDQLRRGKTRK